MFGEILARFYRTYHLSPARSVLGPGFKPEPIRFQGLDSVPAEPTVELDRLLVLTWVEGRVSSEALVPLLERPEHRVEQHLVSGLPGRVQKLPGRHVVVAAWV